MTMWDPGGRRDLSDGGVLLGFQVRLLLKTNFVTATASQGWRPSRITRASTTKCFTFHWRLERGRRPSGMRNFGGLAIARPRIKPRHSTRPTDSFQSSVGNFFLIPLGLRPRSNRQKSTEILLLTQDFLYTDDWRSRSVIYERSE